LPEVQVVDERSGQPAIQRLTEELARTRALYGRGSSQGLEAFHRLVAAYAEAGRRIDELRFYEPDETKRFFGFTMQGSNGHVYWSGSKTGFKRNDGRFRKPVLWWWEHIYDSNPEIVSMSCGEANCINPRHGEITPKGPKRLYPDSAIIGALQVWALQHGRSPSMHLWNGNPSHVVIKKRFGSWNAALKAAGLSAAPHNSPRSAEECLTAVRFVYTLLGHWPSYDEFRAASAELHEHGYPTSPSTIRRHFGVWASTIAAAQR
jgi:hypothetical protein